MIDRVEISNMAGMEEEITRIEKENENMKGKLERIAMKMYLFKIKI